MTKIILALLIAPLTVNAALLPEALGQFERKSVVPYVANHEDLHQEFGLEEGETAHYINALDQGVNITAQRFQDPTGAFAAFFWLKPPKGVKKSYGQSSFQNDSYTIIHFGNYVVEMQGYNPTEEHVELMLAFLPRVQMTALPPMLTYFPERGIIPNSTKHILGPVGLDLIAPKIPPSVAAFHFGTEAHYGRYSTPNGEHQLLLFNYPTPQISRDQFDAFNELGGVVAKRAGPLVAVVPQPYSADEAQRLLARVRYVAEVTPHHREPSRRENLSTLIIDIIIFCCLLAVLMVCGGAIVAAARILAGKYAPNSILAGSEKDSVIRLDIEKH